MSTALYTTVCHIFFTRMSFLTILLTKCVEFFPIPSNSPILCKHNWVRCNSIQFCHYLPGHSISSHRVRAQTQKTVLTSEAHQKSSLLPTCYKLGVPTSLPHDQFAKIIYSTQKNSLFNRLLVCHKIIHDSGKAQGKKRGAFMPPWCTTLPALPYVYQPESSSNPVF